MLKGSCVRIPWVVGRHVQLLLKEPRFCSALHSRSTSLLPDSKKPGLCSQFYSKPVLRYYLTRFSVHETRAIISRHPTWCTYSHNCGVSGCGCLLQMHETDFGNY